MPLSNDVWYDKFDLKVLKTSIIIFAVLSLGMGTAERTLLRQINRSREEHGCEPVHVGARVQRRAERHSRLMRERGYIFHSDLDVTLRGVRWRVAGENVGAVWGEATAPKSPRRSMRYMHRSFMRSRKHRRNILNCSFRKVGLGAAWDGQAWWVTEVFWG